MKFPYETISIALLSLSAVNAAIDEVYMPLTMDHPAVGYLPDGFIIPSSSNRAHHSTAENRDISHHIERLEEHFKEKLIRNVDNLPTQFVMPNSPWPGDYWATYKDGINKRWSPGEDSAVIKYAKAFKMNTQKTADDLSKLSGIDSHPTARSCTNNDDCSGLTDGSVCAIREGARKGKCIPTWWGICHAWAPAAIMEDEPRCPVKVNGVSFEVNDIKALISAMYDGSNVETLFAGNRCYEDEPETDPTGQFKNWACRDLSPDLFHIAVTNIMGRFGKSFVVDADAASQVWNQPTYGYKVDSIRNIPASEASVYYSNFNSKSLVIVQTTFLYIVEAFDINAPLTTTERLNRYIANKKYQYILELDESRNIIGGEWIGDSKHDHLDFIWLVNSRPEPTFQAAGIQYDKVKQILERSVACNSTDDVPLPNDLPETVKPKPSVGRWICSKLGNLCGHPKSLE